MCCQPSALTSPHERRLLVILQVILKRQAIAGCRGEKMSAGWHVPIGLQCRCRFLRLLEREAEATLNGPRAADLLERRQAAQPERACAKGVRVGLVGLSE